MRTGAVCWREITPVEVVRFALQGILPLHGLQPLLHEFAAHYWCANTPVNRAIQMRWLDYVRRSVKLLQSDAFAGDDFAEQVRHFDPNLVAIAAELAGVESCLRPFAEGIATFSEFDFYPPLQRYKTHVPYLTQICMLIAQMNADAAGDKRSDVGSIMRARESLQASRTHEATIGRKGDLLCHPLNSGRMDECYLLGYALIKSIHHKVRQLYGDKLDLEAVISFLIYHVYWDWRIVDLLVSNERVQPAAVMDLISSTIESLFEHDFLERYDSWDKWQVDLAASGQWESGRHNEMPFHGLTTAQIQAIKRKGAAFVVDRLGTEHRGIDLVLAIPRNMLNLCTLYVADVWIEIDPSGQTRLFVDGDGARQLMAGWNLVDPLPAQQTQGQLTIYGTFKPAGEFTLLVSLRFNKAQITMMSRGPGGKREDWLKEANFWLKGDARHHEDIAACCESIETVIEGVDRESGRNVFDDTLAAAEQNALKTYRDLLAGFGGPGQSLLAYARQLPAAEDECGIRSLFDDGRMFDAYSLLGLCNSFTTDRLQLALLLVAQNFDLYQLLQYTDHVAHERRVKLVEQSKNGGIRATF